MTLEYGLRFEWNGTPTEGANRFVNFYQDSVSLIRTRTNGVGGVYKQNYNVEPRVGFAMDIFGTGKSVLRGGYGYMADQPTSNAVTGLASNYPFSNYCELYGINRDTQYPSGKPLHLGCGVRSGN